MDLRCEKCGKAITYSGRGRPPTRFCSRKCKDDQRGKDKRAQAVIARGERQCLNPGCDRIIPDSVTLKAKCCSRECGIAWQNKKRQAAKRAAWLATNPVCQRAQCGKPIPESRPRWSKYCSPECKKKEMDARWRASSPGYNRQYNYGISLEQWAAMLAAQGGVCAICGTAEWGGYRNRPHVDHDHATGVFRGILCGGCNNGLGRFREDPARLRAAADYLERALARHD